MASITYIKKNPKISLLWAFQFLFYASNIIAGVLLYDKYQHEISVKNIIIINLFFASGYQIIYLILGFVSIVNPHDTHRSIRLWNNIKFVFMILTYVVYVLVLTIGNIINISLHSPTYNSPLPELPVGDKLYLVLDGILILILFLGSAISPLIKVCDIPNNIPEIPSVSITNPEGEFV